MDQHLESYVYGDLYRPDLLAMVPSDGQVIGSIGCGTGITEHELVKAGREVHGVDIIAPAIELAKTRLTSARVVTPDERMPFAPDSLDGLILADVIEHIPAAWDYLKGVAAAVRPGGWVVISVPNMRFVGALWHLVVRGDWPEADVGIFDRTHIQVMTKKRLRRWCAAAGLTPERWFDRYNTEPKRRRLSVVVDRLTFRMFNDFFMFQIQVVCRRTGTPGGAAAEVGSGLS